jgi:hypothetical protein
VLRPILPRARKAFDGGVYPRLLSTVLSERVDEVNMCTYAMFTAERQIVIVAIASNWAVSPYGRPPIWQA